MAQHNCAIAVLAYSLSILGVLVTWTHKRWTPVLLKTYHLASADAMGMDWNHKIVTILMRESSMYPFVDLDTYGLSNDAYNSVMMDIDACLQGQWGVSKTSRRSKARQFLPSLVIIRNIRRCTAYLWTIVRAETSKVWGHGSIARYELWWLVESWYE